MTAQDAAELRREVDQQTRLVQGLQVAVFSQADPASNDSLFDKLAEAEAKLEALQQQLADAQPKPQAKEDGPKSSSKGRMLGADTTMLEATVKIQIDPIPTGAYHLMDPEKDPLLTVDVTNHDRDTRRVCVTAYIEGMTAAAVRTIEIKYRETESFPLQPTLLPDRAQAVTEVQRATLHVVVEDLGGRNAAKKEFHPRFTESHNTYPVTLLARGASFNAVRNPETGELRDLSHYYGAWVTPYAEPVQQCIRRAIELAPDRQMLGYQGDPDVVPVQVEALYNALRETEIVYVNSVIDFGAPAGMATQRTRLPRESIKLRSANCIDGTVLLASLMEGVSLNPAIVLIPGHAFVAWEAWMDSGDWNFLETTMIGTSDFEAACQSGQKQYDRFKFNKKNVKLHSVSELRSRGIWPME